MYQTVQIGSQCWIRENLNIGTMVVDHNTGNTHSHCTNNGIIEKYCYNNDPTNCAVYGGLYDWNEMMGYTTTVGAQGICPAGWHIPTDAEWCILSTFLDPNTDCNVWGVGSFIAGGKMKESGTTHWNSQNAGATNESGFTAFAAGYRYYYGGFGWRNLVAYFWSSSEVSTSDGISRGLYYSYAFVYRFNSPKTEGFSVRCVRTN